ncbi:MAG TPA: RNA 2',3'-cyclic phosphodiesterase [Gemmatimonadaceae bacterium]|nr:RNA 2',3'-cyclic phosphodiesterase [Gemmatimonadaceae bacterium]
MRLFVAINLPLQLRQALHDAAAPLREAAPWISWVPVDRLHITVKFIGEQPDEIVGPLAATLGETLAGHGVLDLHTRAIGGFPNFRRPTVVWLGVDPHPRLELLHHDVEVACERHGIDVEGRPFRPHLTLGRVPRRPDIETARALADARRRITFRREIRVESVDLMRSELRPEGALHSVVATGHLRTL